MQLYMRDLVEGATTLVADEPVPGLSWTGSPDWSRANGRQNEIHVNSAASDHKWH